MKVRGTLDHQDAKLAIGAIESELGRRGKGGVVAVGDDHGELVGLLRVGGAPLPSIVIATNKAWTAAREARPSRSLGRSSRDPNSGFDMATMQAIEKRRDAIAIASGTNKRRATGTLPAALAPTSAAVAATRFDSINPPAPELPLCAMMPHEQVAPGPA